MDPEKTTPTTLEEWRIQTASLARKVANNIDNVFAGKATDPKYTLPVLKSWIAQLDELGIKPQDDEFDNQIDVLSGQSVKGVSTDAIRKAADYFSPPEPKSK